MYAVENVIKTNHNTINLDCDDEEQSEEEINERASGSYSSRFSGVSKRMIEQLFNQVEGPDRDWQLEDSGILDEDRETLIIDY